jgi:hypothetical protein
MTQGLLAVTDRRILFFIESRFNREFRMEEWDLRTVTGAEGKRGDLSFAVALKGLKSQS